MVRRSSVRSTSGGVDSSMIAALACHLKGSAINTYTGVYVTDTFDVTSRLSVTRPSPAA